MGFSKGQETRETLLATNVLIQRCSGMNKKIYVRNIFWRTLDNFEQHRIITNFMC